jgi:hypothetical protein
MPVPVMGSENVPRTEATPTTTGAAAASPNMSSENVLRTEETKLSPKVITTMGSEEVRRTQTDTPKTQSKQNKRTQSETVTDSSDETVGVVGVLPAETAVVVTDAPTVPKPLLANPLKAYLIFKGQSFPDKEAETEEVKAEGENHAQESSREAQESTRESSRGEAAGKDSSCRPVVKKKEKKKRSMSAFGRMGKALRKRLPIKTTKG